MDETEINIAKAVKYIENYSNQHKIFTKVPELPLTRYESGKLVAIIDLETTGLDAMKDRITEIGIIILSLSETYQFNGVHNVYTSLNDPGVPISDLITKLTGIDNKLVLGKYIDWDAVQDLIEPVDYILCHKVAFDRKFLQLQTPTIISDMFNHKKYGCTKGDINWKEQGFSNTKLDYLNWASGHYYDAHRAINDCWATLNIVRQTGSFPEVINKINKRTATWEL